MSNADGYASTADYISEFRDRLARELPEELPGSVAEATLIEEYVATDKRTIMIFIKTGPTTVLGVRYKMPVPASGAKIFGLEGLVPHEGPTFSMLTEAEVDGRAASANMRPWSETTVRLRQKQQEVDERIQRRIRNILEYWRIMQRYLKRAYDELNIRYPGHVGRLSSTQSVGGTDPRGRTPRPNSDPRRASMARTLSAPRSSSRRSSSRRTVSRRRSDPARIGPRRFSGKITSDPTRRRRKRTV